MKLALKILMVLGLSLAILVPLSMIRGVIAERQNYRQAAVRDISANHGGRQILGAPVLVVPYTENFENEVTDAAGVVRKVVQRRTAQWTFFPDTLTVDGALLPDTRRRGLHEVRVYRWRGVLRASFDVRIADDAGPQVQRVIGQPWLSYGIADVRGLRQPPWVAVAGKTLSLAQGIGHADGPGLHVRLAAPRPGARIRFDSRLDLDLHGTESFAVMPYAASNDIRLRSSWPHPRFDGMSPQHDIDAAGFSARWQVASVASNAQRRYLQDPSLAAAEPAQAHLAGMPWAPPPDSVSVSLIDPVNPYSQADRASKYGLLFVLLTFVGFFMFELIKQLRIHPIQYALVGLALAIFFLLLVSLSEHIAFGLAYLAASAACIGLLGFYLAHVLRSRARGIGFATMLATLYGALYGLLVSEDNALVLGAGLLFVILAAIMVVTRNVDWYRVSAAGSTAAA